MNVSTPSRFCSLCGQWELLMGAMFLPALWLPGFWIKHLHSWSVTENRRTELIQLPALPACQSRWSKDSLTPTLLFSACHVFWCVHTWVYVCSNEPPLQPRVWQNCHSLLSNIGGIHLFLEQWGNRISCAQFVTFRDKHSHWLYSNSSHFRKKWFLVCVKFYKC